MGSFFGNSNKRRQTDRKNRAITVRESRCCRAHYFSIPQWAEEKQGKKSKKDKGPFRICQRRKGIGNFTNGWGRKKGKEAGERGYKDRKEATGAGASNFSQTELFHRDLRGNKKRKGIGRSKLKKKEHLDGENRDGNGYLPEGKRLKVAVSSRSCPAGRKQKKEKKNGFEGWHRQ